MISQISTLLPQQSKRFSAKINCGNESIDELFHLVATTDDVQAFERIFNKTYKSLCHLSGRMVHSLELAEEIVDDVFYSFWKNRKEIKINSSFTSYLLASVRNRSLDCLRKLKNKQSTSLDQVSEMASRESIAHENMTYEELNRHIEAAIESLPPQCRLIFLMSRDQEMTYKEIAVQLNLSIKTVDTQMGRALKRLREEVKF